MLPERLTITLRPRRWGSIFWVSPISVLLIAGATCWLWDNPNAPAWVQAGGAIIAIAGAALFPYWHEAEKERRKAERLRKVLLYLTDEQERCLASLIDVVKAVVQLGDRKAISDFMGSGRHLIWGPHAQALDAVPIAELEPDHVMAVGALKVGAAYGLELCDRLHEWAEDPQEDELNILKVRKYAVLLARKALDLQVTPAM